jgi:hypothetical protein
MMSYRGAALPQIKLILLNFCVWRNGAPLLLIQPDGLLRFSNLPPSGGRVDGAAG